MFHLIPKKAQWHRWSLPSKLTCIGTYLGVLSLVLTIVLSGNKTVNYGVPPETMLKFITNALVSASNELDDKYPFGCVLFGAANGQLIYKSNLKSVQVQMDWDNVKIQINPTNHLASIFIGRMVISTPYYHLGEFINNTVDISYEDKKSIPLRGFMIPGMTLYLEVLDSTNGLFLFGFGKDSPQ